MMMQIGFPQKGFVDAAVLDLGQESGVFDSDPSVNSGLQAF